MRALIALIISSAILSSCIVKKQYSCYCDAGVNGEEFEFEIPRQKSGLFNSSRDKSNEKCRKIAESNNWNCELQ